MAEVNKYQEGKIYKIWVDWCDNIFIGCTYIKYLSSIKAQHKYKATKIGPKNNKLHDEIREHNFSGWDIELLEDWPCNTMEELELRRDYHINEAKVKGVPLYNYLVELKDEENKYANGKIYRIWVDWCDKQYIGSTIVHLSVRKGQHKFNAKKRRQDSLLYKEIAENDYEGFHVELIEYYPCTNKGELLAREGYYIRKSISEGVTLYNKCIECGNNEEFRKEKIEKDRQHMKKYRKEHKMELSEKQKKYREEYKMELAEKQKKYRETHKEELTKSKKSYYERNKSEINRKNKEWVNRNKDKVLLKNKEKYECVCGSFVLLYGKARHERSKKHQDFVTSKE